MMVWVLQSPKQFKALRRDGEVNRIPVAFVADWLIMVLANITECFLGTCSLLLCLIHGIIP